MQDIAPKFRRAIRNETGIKLTFEQLNELVRYGIVQEVFRLEGEEVCHAAKVNTKPGIVGSKSAATASRPMSGRSQESQSDQSFIAALTAKA